MRAKQLVVRGDRVVVDDRGAGKGREAVEDGIDLREARPDALVLRALRDRDLGCEAEARAERDLFERHAQRVRGDAELRGDLRVRLASDYEPDDSFFALDGPKVVAGFVSRIESRVEVGFIGHSSITSTPAGGLLSATALAFSAFEYR